MGFFRVGGAPGSAEPCSALAEGTGPVATGGPANGHAKGDANVRIGSGSSGHAAPAARALAGAEAFAGPGEFQRF